MVEDRSLSKIYNAWEDISLDGLKEKVKRGHTSIDRNESFPRRRRESQKR